MAGNLLVVGIDGSEAGERALAFARERARASTAELVVVYVIEWSPFTFQTPEENEQRHRRREEELTVAHERVLDPAVSAVQAEGFTASGVIRHGDAAEILESVAVDRDAVQIIVGRTGSKRLRDQFFGSVSSRLAAISTVPVTIVP